MIAQPPFNDFYAALNGRPPFPWQARLANTLGSGGGWPTEIGVPTGLGKTACLDIAVWWLGLQADIAPSERTTPTRIWWLVNRHLLVDATTDHAERVAALLAESPGCDTGAIAAVASRLRALSADPDAAPLQVVRLRGGAATGRPIDPSQPAIVLSTLPMYGSRLLFRGYGSSRSMRPIDAALAGTDSLVLIDEAHLAHHLMKLFDPLAACEDPDAPVLATGRQRPTIVSLTATGSTKAAGRFDLDEVDLAHEVVRQRLGAAKPMRIIELPPKTDTAKHLATAAMELLAECSEPASCIIFTNTPSAARAVAAILRCDPDQVDLVVLTGRQRDRESKAARQRILDEEQGAPATRPLQARHRHLVVVATQTLEVGADVDFEYCVTEACGVRSLTQRLGRLNRLGRFDHAAAAYIHAEPAARGLNEPAWPVYGTEPFTVLRRLQAVAREGIVDLGPGVVAGVLGEPGDDPGRAPEIMPALLWEWVKTTLPPMGEAPVEPYFSGLAQPVRRIAVCWRAHVPPNGEEIDTPVAGSPLLASRRIWPRVRDREVIDLPIQDVREALEEWREVGRLTTDQATVEWVPPSRLRPGDTVVLPADAGLLDEHGWNPESTGVVVDDSLLSNGIPLDAEALARVVRPVPRREIATLLDNEDPDAAEQLLAECVAALSAADPIGHSTEEWQDLVADLDLHRGVVAPRGEVPRLVVKQGDREVRIDAFDELSASARAAVELDAHGVGVEARARAVGEALGLPESLADTVARSARFHDAGKTDARFQRWLDPRSAAAGLLAKSTTSTAQWEAARLSSGWPRGGRHEQLSGRLVIAWLDTQHWTVDPIDADLLVHLVVSHHGHARPFLAPVVDETWQPLTGRLAGEDITVDADLSRADWDQPDRFVRLNQRYGHWGLALLEAIVRQSDHAVSAGAWAGTEEAVL